MFISSQKNPQFKQEISSLTNGDHFDPHTILGLHSLPPDKKVIRLWRPEATSIHIEVFGKLVEPSRTHKSGIFEYPVPATTTFEDYRVFHQDGLLSHDPYAFLPMVGEIDQYLFAKGRHYELYKILGAHLQVHQGVIGIHFAVWAPGARKVSLVGDFNHWDGRTNPMRCLGASGIWELFVPGLSEGMRYKFEVKAKDGSICVKADPYAFSSEMRPNNASVVANIDRFAWTDRNWLTKRLKDQHTPKPINIYEVHLGSWKKKDHHFKNYRELAKELASYCKEMGFTHVELLPISEHPLDDSWGYQVSGYYAATSRFGTPEDFQWFVNHLHENDLGVILDWVPGHFPVDDFALSRFDGTALYEHEDPRQGFHPHWGTYIFNFGRHEVTNFLLANALYWFDKMHVDGLRVDAVASMLYLDYGREKGEWIPNKFGGKENLEAIEFFKHLNSIIHEKHPGILMIAEESTSFPNITKPSLEGGLGFDMKWNMGWMNDTLNYFSKDMIFRQHHHRDLTFGLLYAFTEKFILVLSHDEVVHGKRSLIGRMHGDLWQKFANARLLYSYMICQPGKKLLFMGGEIAQWNEWNCKAEIEWFLLQYPTHHGIQTMVKELNHFYLENDAFWQRDFDPNGFEWVTFEDSKSSVIAYLRKSSHGNFLCIHNFTPEYHADYYFKLSNVRTLTEVFNTDAKKYGGSGKEGIAAMIDFNRSHHATGLKIPVAPLATMIYKVDFYV